MYLSLRIERILHRMNFHAKICSCKNSLGAAKNAAPRAYVPGKKTRFLDRERPGWMPNLRAALLMKEVTQGRCGNAKSSGRDEKMRPPPQTCKLVTHTFGPKTKLAFHRTWRRAACARQRPTPTCDDFTSKRAVAAFLCARLQFRTHKTRNDNNRQSVGNSKRVEHFNLYHAYICNY